MDWSCFNCTFENGNGRQKCEMCNAERPTKALEELFAQQSLTEWQCLKCNTFNNGNKIRCAKCGCVGTWSVDSAAAQTTVLSHDDSQDQAVGGAPWFVLDDEGISSRTCDQSLTDCLDQVVGDTTSELRVVLLGRTGEGKSATANTILGIDVFESVLSPASVTKECQRGTCTRFGRDIQVIDTPGMYDTEMSIQEITREVFKCAGMTAPGPHAFLLVIKPDRFTEEVQNTIDHFRKMFGDEFHRHLIIVFTKKDELNYSGKTIEEYLEKDAGQLQSLLASCSNRYVAFNNRGTPNEKDDDVRNLLDLIDEVIQENGGVYTSEMFQEAERIMKEREEKLRQEHALDVMRQTKMIEEVCRQKLCCLEENYIDITDQLQRRLHELENQQKSGKPSSDVADIRKQLQDMRDHHAAEMKQIRKIASADKEGVRNQVVNYREKARKEVDGKSSFFKDILVPQLFDLAKIALPLLLTLATAIVKRK